MHAFSSASFDFVKNLFFGADALVKEPEEYLKRPRETKLNFNSLTQ